MISTGVSNAPVNVKNMKSVDFHLKGNEAKVLAIILTEYSRNITKLLMTGRIRATPDLEKELVIVTNVLEKLAVADFALRADKNKAAEMGLTFGPDAS